MGSTFGARRALAAVHGALLAAWWSAWMTLTVRAAEHGWWQVPLSPAEGRQFFPFEQALELMASRNGMSWVHGLGSFSATLVAAGAVLGFLLAWLGQRLHLDPERLSLQAIVESACNPRQWLTWLGLPIATIVAATLVRNGGDFAELLPATLALAWTIAAPFLVLDRRKLLPRPQRAPLLPRWPGLLPLLWALAAWGLGIVAQMLCNFISAAVPALGVPLEALAWLAGLATGIYFVAAWIDGVRGPLRQLLAPRVALGFAVLSFRSGVLLAWLGAPVFAAFISWNWVLPQMAGLASARGVASLGGFAHLLGWLSVYWWTLALPVLVPANLAFSGRLYVKLFSAPPGAAAPSTA